MGNAPLVIKPFCGWERLISTPTARSWQPEACQPQSTSPLIVVPSGHLPSQASQIKRTVAIDSASFVNLLAPSPRDEAVLFHRPNFCRRLNHFSRAHFVSSQTPESRPAIQSPGIVTSPASVTQTEP